MAEVHEIQIKPAAGSTVKGFIAYIEEDSPGCYSLFFITHCHSISGKPPVSLEHGGPYVKAEDAFAKALDLADGWCNKFSQSICEVNNPCNTPFVSAEMQSALTTTRFPGQTIQVKVNEGL